MTSHHLQLDDNQLIFIVEHLGVAYLRAQVTCVRSGNTLPAVVFYQENVAAIQELLRQMLREPLKDRTFRRQLLEHFDNHPFPDLRTNFNEFLVETLTWDS